MRLIDADELMKKIREVDFMADAKQMKVTHDSTMSGFFWGTVQGIVDRMPTAYDLDKVVEALEELKEDAEWDCEVVLDDRHKEVAINRAAAFLQAVDIVKKGGV